MFSVPLAQRQPLRPYNVPKVTELVGVLTQARCQPLVCTVSGTLQGHQCRAPRSLKPQLLLPVRKYKLGGITEANLCAAVQIHGATEVGWCLFY